VTDHVPCTIHGTARSAGWTTVSNFCWSGKPFARHLGTATAITCNTNQVTAWLLMCHTCFTRNQHSDVINDAGFGTNDNGSKIGADGNGSKIGSSGNLQVMGSMAFGLGTSAVGSPGFGQFLGPSPSTLISNAAMNPQLGGDQTLLSRQEAAPSGGNQQAGTYHPFGSSGGLNVGLQNTGLNQGMQRVIDASPL